MAEYSKEFSEMKGLAAKQLKDMIAGIKSGAIKMRGNEPKMSYRALRSLLLSEDKTHADLVESLLSGKLTIEQFKNKIRTRIETTIPNKVRILRTDRIHHKTPLELAEILSEMPDNELREFLTQSYETQGLTYGDSDGNTRGSSFDERAHTGARPKASKSKIVYPNTLGPDGLREVSAHPRGTRDTLYSSVTARPTTVAEANKTIQPLLEQAQQDFNLGVIADTPRRNQINGDLKSNGLLSQDGDIFSATTSDETIKAARKTLDSADLQKRAALAFKTPKVIDSTRMLARAKKLGPLSMLAAPAVVLATGGSPAEAAGAFVDSTPVVGDITSDNTADGTRTANMNPKPVPAKPLGSVLFDQFRRGIDWYRKTMNAF